MGFRFIYEPNEIERVVAAVNIDSRADIPAIKNKIGIFIKEYNDIETAKAQTEGGFNVLFFKIETIYTGDGTADGVLAGYFSLFVKGHPAVTASLYQFQLRPNFYQNTTQLNAEISLFLSSNQWNQYALT